MQRCAWAEGQPDFYVAYHDDEWGMPAHRSDADWFEFLCLEGAQAGLSWRTILAKRDGYRRAFHGFDIDAVAGMPEAELEALREDAGIVRNRLKIWATRDNAVAAERIIRETGSLDAFFWSWVDGKPIQNRFEEMSGVPAETDLAKTLSKDLKKRGFRFVGPTIVYAFMQATGMVNDHLTGCFRREACAAAAETL